MNVNFNPMYPIFVDWIIVVVLSVSLVFFIWKYGYKHPGLHSFLIVEIMLLALVFSWNNIFDNSASQLEQPISAFAQMLMLAPLVSAVVGTIMNVKINWDSRDNANEVDKP
jgi:uncharacterized membrane protein